MAQWKPIVAWLDPVLRTVHKPVLRGNPSVSRPVLPPLKFRDDERVAVPALADADADVDADVAMLAAPHVAPARALPPAPAAAGAATAAPERARPAGDAAAPAPRLGSLFGWLTTPRFRHRNP